jgi:signal-transduction protein with cAMP-binding, CBS, and nucleotidyltransferase domain
MMVYLVFTSIFREISAALLSLTASASSNFVEAGVGARASVTQMLTIRDNLLNRIISLLVKPSILRVRSVGWVGMRSKEQTFHDQDNALVYELHDPKGRAAQVFWHNSSSGASIRKSAVQTTYHQLMVQDFGYG